MCDGSDDEKLSVVIDSNDLLCPVTFEKYSESNYPVTLPCGHTLSIQAFEGIKKTDNSCPSCRKIFPGSFFPKKTILLGNIAKQIQDKRKINCHNHPQEKAVALCIEEKAFLCVDCLVEDEHPKEKKISFQKLNKYMQERKQALREGFEKLQDVIIDEDEVNKVTAAIMKNIESSIQKLVKSELQDGRTEGQGFEGLIKKIDWIINNNLIAESVDVLNEIDNYSQSVVNSQEKSMREGENIRMITRRIVDSLENVFQIESGARKKSEVSIALKEDVENLAQIHNKEKIKKLSVDFLKGFQQIQEFCSNIPGFTFLTWLELNFDSCQKMNDLAIKNIGVCLKGMSFLTTLDLNFSRCTISNAGLKDLSLQIKNLVLLQNLGLDFADCGGLTNAGFKEFAKCLKVFSVLGNLKLSIFNNKNIDENGIKVLSESLKSLVQLNDLQLNFGRTLFSSQGVVELLAGIKDLEFLSSLKLGLADCGLINEAGFVELTAGLGSFLQLECLDIDMEGCKAVNDTIIECFGGNLESVTALRTLNLNFYECMSMTSDSIKALNRYLKSLDVLENLKLKFGTSFLFPSSLKEEFLTDLSVSIGALKNLKDLTLVFGKLKTAAPLANSLGPCLSNLRLLESLKLQFYSCRFMTDDEIIEIGKRLSELNHLKTLKLSFSGCQGVSDPGVQALGQGLRNLEGLNDLSLEFLRCYLISDVAIIELAKQVKNLRFVNKLKLDFRQSNSFSDAGMVELCNCIKKFPKMVELSLWFGYSVAISDRGIKELSLAVKGLNDLQKLSLRFEGYDLITDNGMNELSVGIKDLIKMEKSTLCFNFCKSIKDEGVRKIIKNIEDSLKNLHKLHINFDSCKSVGNQVKTRLNQLMLTYK